MKSRGGPLDEDPLIGMPGRPLGAPRCAGAGLESLQPSLLAPSKDGLWSRGG